MQVKKFLFLILFIFSSSESFAKQAEAPAPIEKLSIPASSYVTLKVERIIDGDTVVASGIKVRLWGIDAPEKTEKLYDFSRNFLEEYLSQKNMLCKLIEFDKYQRQVMHCYVDDNDLGAIMVSLGLAKDYKRYSAGFYQREQANAQEKKLGIWQLILK